MIVAVLQDGIPFWIHAYACIFVYSNCLYPYMQFHALCFLLFEASTPILHTRFLLILFKKADTILFKISELALFIVFFLARIVFGVLATLDWMKTTFPSLSEGTAPSTLILGLYYVINFALMCLNFYWFSLMMAKACAPAKKEKK